MHEIQCPKPAYDKIISSGLDKKILKSREDLFDILLYDSINLDKTEFILEEAKEFWNECPSEKSFLFKDILELEGKLNKYYSRLDFEKIVMGNPSFFGYLILGKEIFNYKKYGFPDLKSLTESIASFCFGEKQLFSDLGTDYHWRNSKWHNEISQNVHGDLFAGQRDISGKSWIEETLFGKEEKFDSYKISDGRGISAYQDWSEFLMATLRYAEYLGKSNLEEIVNWRETLEKAGGGVGTATAEAYFGGSSFTNGLLKQIVLSDKMEKLEYPIQIFAGRSYTFLPYIKENKLLYLREKEDGEIKLDEKFKLFSRNYSISLEYSEEDLPHILTATYKYFARDRSLLPIIMDSFNLQK